MEWGLMRCPIQKPFFHLRRRNAKSKFDPYVLAGCCGGIDSWLWGADKFPNANAGSDIHTDTNVNPNTSPADGDACPN